MASDATAGAGADPTTADPTTAGIDFTHGPFQAGALEVGHILTLIPL